MSVGGADFMRQAFLRSAAQSCAVVIFFLFLISSNAFGQGSNPFLTPPTFPGTGQALSADVNGDGKPDLLFFDGTVLLGKGDGTFTIGTAWKSTASPNLTANQFAIADFNGDGKPDIFVAGPLNVLSVMLGNGDGTFQAPVTTSIASPAVAFVIGDLNGDGKPDVLAQVGSAALTYLGKGDGAFSAGIASNAASPEVANAFADFNGDGKLDLLVPGSGIQLGNGDGTFQALLPFPSGALTASATLGDFDGDGKLDVFVTGGTSTSPEIQVLFGNGDGTFRAASPQSVAVNTGILSPVAVDLSGDGKADIVGSTGSAVQVLISKGDGTFTLGEYFNAPAGQAGSGAANMVVADFNSDKKKDVAAFNTMLLGNGDGTLKGNAAVPGAFGFNAMGDFNGDGHPDFASVGPIQGSTTNPNGYQANLNIWLNDGKNSFTLAHTYAINIPFPDVADTIGLVVIGTAADVNGDGKIDLVGYLADSSGLSMIVLLGNGDGSFGAPIATGVPSAGLRLLQVAFTLGDVNGDGKPDLLVNAGNAPSPGTLYVFLNTGGGTFGPPSTPFVGGSFGNIVVGDFNNDKKLDLITGTANGLGVLLGNGDGTFQPTTFISNSACGTACGTPVSADFNGDGNLDLMVAVVNGYQVLLGKGDGTFDISPAVTVSAGTFGGFFQVADFNGDGNLDVLGSIGTTNPSLGLILGNGDGTFGSPLPVTNAGFPFVADFNGDNQLDILEVGANQLVFLFNGTGPGFSMSAGSGASSTVAAGKTASYSLSLSGSGGFSGSVALTCSGAPAGAVCDVSPSSVTLSGTILVTAMVSITTTAGSQLLPSHEGDRCDPPLTIIRIFSLLLVIAGASGFMRLWRGRHRRFSLSFTTAFGVLVLITASLIAGCGGSGSATGSGPGSTVPSATGTPAGTYTITVTATAGSGASVVSHTRKLTLVVQ
jgi:hypothetical protein